MKTNPSRSDKDIKAVVKDALDLRLESPEPDAVCSFDRRSDRRGGVNDAKPKSTNLLSAVILYLAMDRVQAPAQQLASGKVH